MSSSCRARSDAYSVPLVVTDFEHGRLAVDSFIRPNRLFTVERSVVLYVPARVTPAKLQEVRTKIRQLFA
jgi:mRNA interferase MazF